MKHLSKDFLYLALALVLPLALFGLTACDNPAGDYATYRDDNETRTITDALNREVEIPAQVNSIITLGPGAPRLAAYLDVVDMLVGAEEYNTEDIVVLRDYNPVHIETFRELPIVGQGGGSGDNNGFPEEIIITAPDVIIAAFDLEAADELQAQTNIPVVSVRHRTGLFDDTFATALHIFADVVGVDDRAFELMSYIYDLQTDLNARTEHIYDGDKPRVYAGAVTWNGRRGFAGTYSNFGPLAAIGAYNVADASGIDGFFEADFESVLVWDPDIIFLDPGNMDLVNAEYTANPDYFNSLRAAQEGRVYGMPAFNFSGTNITYALINVYYAGTILFPEEFDDIDIEGKAREILEMFLGADTFDVIHDGGLRWEPITIGQ